ncbi:MAG TPA: CGNR zinc finger domain-containing protein [Solirubrobacteraceae bacterium]|nr:CGNR zinc finger domain-containing protein [Solirubrobacteraceae bacterium]
MSNPAPGALETVRAFVNTLDTDDDIEELSGPRELVDWLAGNDLLDEPGAVRATQADLRRAIELREALRAHLFAHHGDPLAAGAAEALDAASRRARLTVRFSAVDETSVEPEAAGVDGAIGRLLAIVAEAIDEGTWQRLKACPAEDCQWAFYDASRNRSAVWCDMRVCGNRAKVRGFRERARGGDADDADHRH